MKLAYHRVYVRLIKSLLTAVTPSSVYLEKEQNYIDIFRPTTCRQTRMLSRFGNYLNLIQTANQRDSPCVFVFPSVLVLLYDTTSKQQFNTPMRANYAHELPHGSSVCNPIKMSHKIPHVAPSKSTTFRIYIAPWSTLLWSK